MYIVQTVAEISWASELRQTPEAHMGSACHWTGPARGLSTLDYLSMINLVGFVLASPKQMSPAAVLRKHI